MRSESVRVRLAETQRASTRVRSWGFTLIELMVVLLIVGVASAGVALALRGNESQHVQQDAQRLAALLEAARARSRMSGVAVFWQARTSGFVWRSAQPDLIQDLPTQWLHASTQAEGNTPAWIQLGPEPLLPPQSIALSSNTAPGLVRQVSSQGLWAFAVQSPKP